MARGWQNGQQIEVALRGRDGWPVFGESGVRLHHEADFIFDMTNFTVKKDRYALWDGTPEGACKLLTHYLSEPQTRILLLTD